MAKSIVPDVLPGPHVAPLESVFYTGTQFPASYRHGAFIAEHGSWNRSIHSGYAMVSVPFCNGQPSGPPINFRNGFDPNSRAKAVDGGPVGVAVTKMDHCWWPTTSAT